MSRHLGDSVTIDAEIVALLWRHSNIRELRERNRGANAKLDETLEDLRIVAGRWTRGVASATLADAGVPIGVDSEHSVTVAEAADALGVTPQAIRKAIADGRMQAAQVGRQWLIDRTTLAEYVRERTSGE